MYLQFQKYIRRENLFDGCSRFLIAVSGGVDSVVLTDLMWRYAKEHEGVELALVHCNFHLRGEESDRDENFVREYAARLGLPLFVEHFDTLAYASEHKVSVEMAARELRYGFFERLMYEEGYDACCLAHHADDNAETFFINLFRGSGVKGLRGMKPCTHGAAPGVGAEETAWLRPLLWARRKQIEEYAHVCNLPHVEDSTNASQIYLRNKIRHSVLPLLEQVSEGFTEKVNQSMETLRRVDALVDDWMWKMRSRHIVSPGFGEEYISLESVEEMGRHWPLFFELYLLQRGFSRAQIAQIRENEEKGTAGKEFSSVNGHYVLYREPKGWRLRYLPSDDCPWEEFDWLKASEQERPDFKAERVMITDKKEIDPRRGKAYLDYDKLQFPLTWRHPRPGDNFKPLGTRGFKKLSDFFKDEKVGVCEREAAWLLCSGEDIVWVAGYRIDDRYKLSLDGVNPRRAWVVELAGMPYDLPPVSDVEF